jgi:glycosyltransferase involved in cell wall biosynthesis
MMLRKLVLGHDRQRFRPAIVSCGDLGVHGAIIRAAGIPVWCLNMRRGWPTPRVLVSLARIIRSFRPHLMQSWLYHADVLLSLARYLEPVARKAKWAWNIRCSQAELEGGWTLLRLLTAALARISDRPDVVIANSRAGIDHHCRIGYHPRRWVSLPNGFDCMKFRPDPSARAILSEELKLPSGSEIVTLIARFDPLKDHENFLSAIALSRRERDGIRAVMVGKGITRENHELMSKISKHGLAGSVALLGERDDLSLIAAASSVVVLSSLAEGFPNVIGEAMASGTPCVVTDVGDSQWMVGDTGIVVPSRDSTALASGIIRLLAETRQEHEARGSRARQRILTHFGLEGIVARYEKLYTTMLGYD